MSHRNPILTITAAALIGMCFNATKSTAAQTPDFIGQWSRVASMPFYPVHSNLLPVEPMGKVMIWSGDGQMIGNDPRAWDPTDPFNLDPANATLTANVSTLSKPNYNLFCGGHTSLADGTLFVAGGHISNFVGLSRASKYNYLTDTWTPLADMNAGRWYPTTTALANGDVLTISGDIDTTVGINPLPQVFEVSTGTWRDLTSAVLTIDDYPRNFLAPNGKVVNVAPSPITRYLDTAGTGAWSMVATRVGGYRDYGSAVMYAPGKILVMGGDQQPPNNTAEVIDLNQTQPSWRAVGSMQYARRHHNATLLPDGKVLVTGGTSSSGFNDPTGHIDAAELWDPVTENWTTLASSSGIPRVYHSSALLLPDGRIFSTGGNAHPETELYSPPYLFKGDRPTITSAPSSVAYGETFLVNTSATDISKVTMLRIGATTHAFNMGQVISDLSFTQTADGLNVLAPPNANVAPPGYYMLFILNGSGVPSVAKFVKMSAGPKPQVVISAPANGATVAGAHVTVSASATDDVGVSGVQFQLDGTNIGVEDITSPYTVGWDSTAVTDGSHTLTAIARDADGNTTTSAGVTVTVNNTILLPDLIVTSVSYANGIFTSTVKNYGTAATPDGVTIGVQYAVDSVYRTWGSVAGPLAAGASVTVGTKGGSYIIPDGKHTLRAWTDDVNRIVELDETNNQLYQQVTVDSTIDTLAPTVSMTAPANGSAVSGSAVTLSADASDNFGVSSVQFQVTGSYPLPADTTAPYTVAWDSTAVADGSHTITAVALDAAGNTTTSAGVTVTVNNTTPPPSLPDVIVTELSYNNGIFTSTVKNQGTAATPSGVTIGVKYAVDGASKTWGSVAGPLAAGASITVGTQGGSYFIPSGGHTISALADDVNRFTESDETNNKLSQSITVAPDTLAPTVSMTAPADGATVSGSAVIISANATDDVGVAGVQFKLGDTNIGAEDATSPYSIAWDSTAATNGLYTLTAVARDAVGNTATSAGVNVTVNNTALPDVIVTSVSYNNGIFTSTVKNQGTAATPSGVTIGVKYAVDGASKTWGSVVGPLDAGASVTVGTKGGSYTIPSGAHTISALADDVNRFPESNENNNKLSVSITVP